MARKATWFVIGILTMPFLSTLRSLVYPTATEAMGFTPFYEEHLWLYPWIGENEYSLSFPGNHQDFVRFAERMGFKDHRVSENEYHMLDSSGAVESGVTFDGQNAQRSIRYQSSTK